MNKTIKRSLTMIIAAMAIVCLLVGACLFTAMPTYAAAPTKITFDGDFTTAVSDTTYVAVGGATSMGGGVGANTLPTGDGMGWTVDNTLEGADGSYIRTSVHPWAWRPYQRIIFNTPIKADDFTSMTFRMYLDLCTDNRYADNHGSVGIWLYGLDDTGLAGEGVLIPFEVTQREWIDFLISDADYEKFVDADGEIKGFKMASGVVNGDDQGVLHSSERAVVNIDTITFAKVSKYTELTAADFVNGKATLFTGNGDYEVGGAHATQVNGATAANYSTWGCTFMNGTYDNIHDLNMANDGAVYSFADMKAASNDGYAIAMEAQGFGPTGYQNIDFNTKVKVSDIGSLTFRMFASFTSNGTPYCGYSSATGGLANDPGGATPYNGMFFYSKQSDCSYGSGVMLNPLIKQREWTEVTLTGADLAKLADADGYISGFRFGSAFMSGADTQLLGAWGTGRNQKLYDKVACVIIDEITVTAATAVAEDQELVLFDGANGNIVKTAYQKVEGMDRNSLNAAWPALKPNMGDPVGYNNDYVDLYNLTPAAEGALFDLGAMKSGSEDGHAMAMQFSIVGYTMSPTVYFDQVVNTSDVNSLTFRVYANISSEATYGKYNPETGKFITSGTMQDSEGIYIYSADKNGAGEGVLIKGDVTQREWIDITLTGADLAKLADANGNIAGFKVGAGFVLNGGFGPYMYKQDAAYDLGNSLFIDSVVANKPQEQEGVKFMSISTEGDIGVNFYAYLEDAKTATFTFKGETSEAVDGVYDEETGCYKFTYAVAPVDYKEEIQINIGEDIEATYSVYQYSQDINEESDAYALVVALMDYCEAANVYFNNDVAEETEALDVDLSAYASSISGSDDRLNVIGASLILEDKTSIYVYFEAEDINGIEFAVDGEAVEPVAVAGKYVIKIENIVAKDLDKTFTITVGGYTITYSALSYVNTVNNGEYGVALANVVKAIYAVSVQAEAYFA